MELENAENLVAEKKMRQRLSFEETVLYIFGYIANLVSLWIVSLAMFPGGLVGRNSNAKFLADFNFRKPLFDNQVWVLVSRVFRTLFRRFNLTHPCSSQ